jgi:parallel beta-helix repeat protein
MTTYYVSSQIGSDNNAGTSATVPLASLQAAEGLVKPGDTVEVMNGTYTGPAGAFVLDITTSGAAGAPITFEAAPGQKPVIDSTGTWSGINVQASYNVINGFTVVGDAANYTLAQAMAQYSTDNANLDGNGISISSPGGGVNPNHITIENNTVYNEPGGGIATIGADYVQILNNVVHDNAHWSAYGNSGISVFMSANSDTNSGVHDIISGNTAYNNTQLVPTTGGNTITDGEGIILDTNTGYTGGFLVENNTVYGNGSTGIVSFLSDNATITGNTVYGNNTGNIQAASNAEIFINQSNNNTVTNNITTAPVTSTGGTPPVTSTGGTPPVTSTGGTPPVTSTGGTNLVANGNFATGDFTDWTLGGNYISPTYGPQIVLDGNVEGASTFAAGMGSVGSDGTLSQTIATAPGQTYTLNFWLQNEGSGANDFQAIWNGHTLLSLTNAAQSGYTEHTYTVTATGSTSTLEFSAANGPSQWDLDNISLTGGTSSVTSTGGTPPVTSTGGTPPVTSTGGTNLIANGNFATGDFTDWTLGGNYTSTTYGPEIYIDGNAEGASTYAAGMGSVGSDGTLSQTVATTAGQTYTLSFWLQNEGSGANDFQAIWNGHTLLSLTNAAQSGYREYTYTVTATGSTSTLEFSAANGPSQWDLDNISLTGGASPVTSTGGTPPLPTLSIANNSLSVAAHSSVALGIGVTAPDSGGAVSVTIKGLPRYETITDNLDHQTFRGSSITLTAAEVNSGLALNSNYRGGGQPVATLTVTATDSAGTTAPQSITVKDPPAMGSSTNQAFALLTQYLAGGVGNQTGHGHVTTDLSVTGGDNEPFLAHPRH